MLLEVFDKNLNRLITVMHYPYTQYLRKFNSAGDFEMRLYLDDVAKTIFSQGKFILFEKNVCGIVTYFGLATDEDTNSQEFSIKGYTVNWLLDLRSISTTEYFSGTTAEIAVKIVNDNCVNPVNTKRKLPIIISSEPLPESASISTQITGANVREKVESLLETENMGYEVVPIISGTKLTGFEFRILKGADRTVGNTAGNPPILFSVYMKNILTSNYIYNTNDFRNMAYVAGEGEGSQRTIVTIGDEYSGIDRVESFVDARDLQRETQTESGTTKTLTPEEYRATLLARGEEKLNEQITEEVYEAEINSIDNQYVFEKDYFLGDWVTVEDRRLGLQLTAQITEAQITSLGERSILGLSFGNYKYTTAKKLRRNGVI